MAGAYALSLLLAIFLDRLLSNISSLFVKHLLLLVDPVLERFELSLAEIRPLVLEAKNRSTESEPIRRWLMMVQDVLFDADDLLDRMHRLQLQFRSKFFRFLLDLVFKTQMESILQRLRSVREMSPQMAATGTPICAWGNLAPFEVTNRETCSLISESFVVGRERDQEFLLGLLFRDDYESKLNIIPIVGMGGVGKTLLAQMIFNDRSVSLVSSYKSWVSVGLDFDLARICRAILGSDPREPLFMNMEESLAAVRSRLEGMRFLIVLDDVWNEDVEKLNVLLSCLTNGVSGSAVIVTTRSEVVAALIGTVEAYRLKPLSDSEGWSLFQNLVDLERVSSDEFCWRLVEECEGLPLAVKNLAAQLRFKREESLRQLLENNSIWNLQSPVLEALKLSYDHLPAHLKQCFSYCSVFPKGFAIGKKKLIQLWIAQGFVRSSDGSGSEEQIGDDYFMELLHRSFFLVTWEDDFGHVVECRMHGLIHDLARLVASPGCVVVESRTQQNVYEGVCHAFLVCYSDQHRPIFEQLSKIKKLRTLLLSSSNLEQIPALVFELKRLRSLDFSGTGIRSLPSSVGDLMHLRHLDLSHTAIEKLPRSIRKLQYLCILELSGCYKLKVLPAFICELKNLIHLDIQSCYLLTHIPPHIGELRRLQKLPLFVLSNIGDCSYITELQKLDLRGELEIKNLEYVLDPEDAVSVQLSEKHNLWSLKLSWGYADSTSPEASQAILENLMPAPELKALHLTGYNGVAYPTWIAQSFCRNLINVSLINCSCQELPPLGQLPKLKDLHIGMMDMVEEIDEEFYGRDYSIAPGFPSLKHFELFDMHSLKIWRSPSSADGLIRAFPCLESLIIKRCLNLSILPVIPNLEKLGLWNCNQELLLSLGNLTSLSSLVINEFRGSLHEPLGNLHSTRKMTLYDCDDLLAQLESSMEGFSSLEHLRILCCDGLESLPTGLAHLSSLQRLDIVECSRLSYIPEITQSLSLQELVINGCPMLDSLPDGISVQELVIDDCQMLESLPDGISVQKLVIRKCPLLSERLAREVGADWYKIKHIPIIEID